MVKESEKKEKVVVVKELPTQQISRLKDDKTGEIVRLITIEEALTELLNK